MSSNARRSERLRRKRQSTPGLTQPGSYSLYGSGYVVESEASFLPEATPPSTRPFSASDSRRLRYKDSPHNVFAVAAAAADSSRPADLPADITPPATRRRASLIDRVRISLFDILGSDARRPARNDWRAITTDRDAEILVYDDDDDHNGHDTNRDTARSSARRRRPHAHRDNSYQDSDDRVTAATPSKPSARLRALVSRNRALIPVATLLFLLLASIPVLLALESITHSRTSLLHRATHQSAWRSVRDKASSTLSTLPSIPSFPFSLPRPSLAPLKSAVYQTGGAVKAAFRWLFRGAWSSPIPSGDFISRDELRAVILPNVLSAARAAAKASAAEEAARVTRELDPARTSARGSDNFNTFAERYAADKGLPADYALLSVGGGVAASQPSTPYMYARFVRQYFEALVTQSKYTPLVPNRPQVALTPEVLPGNCWAFPGERGSLTIRLARPVRPTSVTIEHTPKRSVFSTLSAPRRFKIYGVPVHAKNASVGHVGMVDLGEFMFDMSDERRHLQSFVVNGGADVAEMRMVKVEILSNHGSAHTCLYRVRVHGTEVEERLV